MQTNKKWNLEWLINMLSCRDRGIFSVMQIQKEMSIKKLY